MWWLDNLVRFQRRLLCNQLIVIIHMTPAVQWIAMLRMTSQVNHSGPSTFSILFANSELGWVITLPVLP